MLIEAQLKVAQVQCIRQATNDVAKYFIIIHQQWITIKPYMIYSVLTILKNTTNSNLIIFMFSMYSLVFIIQISLCNLTMW